MHNFAASTKGRKRSLEVQSACPLWWTVAFTVLCLLRNSSSHQVISDMVCGSFLAPDKVNFLILFWKVVPSKSSFHWCVSLSPGLSVNVWSDQQSDKTWEILKGSSATEQIPLGFFFFFFASEHYFSGSNVSFDALMCFCGTNINQIKTNALWNVKKLIGESNCRMDKQKCCKMDNLIKNK